jgi:hypothetical protein
MNSLPTGATQPLLIVAIVGISPIITFIVADAIGQLLRSIRVGRRVAPRLGRERGSDWSRDVEVPRG